MSACMYPFIINGVVVPCGKCQACRIEYVNTWARRAQNEFNTKKQKALFVTLTYDDEHLPKDLGLHSDDFKKFIKKLRKKMTKNKDNRKIKYFGCGEYGSLGRCHFHSILYNLDIGDSMLIKKCWSNGFVDVKPCHNGSFAYIAKYALKTKTEKQKYIDLGLEPEQCYFSKGIGLQYVEENRKRLEKDLYQLKKGKKTPLSSYEFRILNYSRDLNKDKDNPMRNHLNTRRNIAAEKNLYENASENDLLTYGNNMTALRLAQMKDRGNTLVAKFRSRGKIDKIN